MNKKYYVCDNCEEYIEGKKECCEEQKLIEITKYDYLEGTDQNILYDRS